MIFFFSISELTLGIVFAICVAIVFMFFGGIIGIGEKVIDFANQNTFYILIFLVVIICIASFIFVYIKCNNTCEIPTLIVPILLITASLSISLTNVWTMIVSFFGFFTELGDPGLLIIFGWLLFLIGAIFCGVFSLLFLVFGFAPIFIGYYFEEEYLNGNLAVIISSIPVIILDGLALLKLTPYFMNSIAHIF